ncbi:MAG TPA: GAF domain-containing sensor histidine kinase [Candidatus Acidoferrum sp.]|nr:GAF domain-containing sensor histidine kinase [Candidatus Acidoferrum sp.]
MIADRSFDDAQRIRVLADVAGAVAWASDARAALRRVAELMVPTLADWCAVDILEGEATYRRLAVVHVDAQWQGRVDALLGPWAPDPDRVGVARVVRTGESQIAAEASAAAALVPSGDAERERLVTQLGVAGYVSVPMLFNARPFGALTLVVADARRRFADGDVALVETLARMAGLAVANARLEHELADTHRRQDDLLAALSHQLRTPLTAMLAWLHLARRPDADGSARALETIERNGRVLGRRIDELMDTARILTGKVDIDRRPLDLAGIVEHAVLSQRGVARHKGVRLDIELQAPAAGYVGDRARVEQIVVVLLANAVKFTPSGGRVVARLDGDGSRARIRVTDSGRGISAELLPHVFELFRRGPSEPGDPGLGLGLAMVRGLVKLHGGTVEAASEGVDRGATFTVLLPRAP